MKNNIIFVILLLQFITILACMDQQPDQSPQSTSVQQPVKENKETPSPNTSKAPDTKAATESKAESLPIPAEQLEKAKEIIAGISETEVSKIDAKQKFRAFCATCHGFKGDMSNNGTKELVKSTYNVEENVALIYFGRGTMTSYKTLLSSAEIVALAKYVEEEIKN